MTIGEIYPHSTEVRNIFLKSGWDLIDVTDKPEDRPFSWEELQEMSAATEYVVGREYFVIRIPSFHQTYKEAYAITQSVGPCLRMDDRAEYTWTNRDRDTWGILCFTRLRFKEEGCTFYTPPIKGSPYKIGEILVGYPVLLDKMKQDYHLTTTEAISEAFQEMNMKRVLRDFTPWPG